MNLEQVRLLVKKFDECFHFYRDVMEFKVNWGKEGSSYASFTVGEKINLAIFNREAMAKALGTSTLPSDVVSQDRVALVFNVEDVDAMGRKLKKGGTRLVAEPKDYPDWGIRAAHVRDPDGNLIEIENEMPKGEWSQGLLKEDAAFHKSED